MYVKKFHQVYSAGIRTHDLQNMSHLPQPLDQGSRTNTPVFCPTENPLNVSLKVATAELLNCMNERSLTGEEKNAITGDDAKTTQKRQAHGGGCAVANLVNILRS